MGILTQVHRDHFDEYGYMVIENAVPMNFATQLLMQSSHS